MKNYRYQWGLKRAFVIVLILFFLNWIGVIYGIHSALWWWDVMTHMLGGVVIGFLVFGLNIRYVSYNLKKDTTWLIWVLSLCCIFIGWELYEIIVSQTLGNGMFDAIDTMHDIINDLLGGLISYFWIREFL